MTLQIATIAYLFVAIAMVVMILMQRGSGAGAGAGFGGGGSQSVFGASGSSNFLSKMTKWLAIVFFVLSLGMAMYVSRGGAEMPGTDLGVMGGLPAAEESLPPPQRDVPEAPQAPLVEPADVPPAPVAEPEPEPRPEPEDGSEG